MPERKFRHFFCILRRGRACPTRIRGGRGMPRPYTCAANGILFNIQRRFKGIVPLSHHPIQREMPERKFRHFFCVLRRGRACPTRIRGGRGVPRHYTCATNGMLFNIQRRFEGFAGRPEKRSPPTAKNVICRTKCVAVTPGSSLPSHSTYSEHQVSHERNHSTAEKPPQRSQLS